MSLFRHVQFVLTAASDSHQNMILKLRDHPLMTRKSGFCNWPPIWMTGLDNNDTPKGEIGTLQQVLTNDLLNVYIFIDYQGCRYLGVMTFDDEKFCSEIYSVLKNYIGYSLKEIGDLDLSYTL
jgi:hypothetical protein